LSEIIQEVEIKLGLLVKGIGCKLLFSTRRSYSCSSLTRATSGRAK